jgi:hypothetical protein
MAYQLQPGLNIVNGGGVPTNKATDDVFVYPQPSALNYCCRPSTMVFGTAPYMAGKGSPAQHIEVSDQLRPQATTRFNKVVVKPHESGFFPLNDVECKVPLRTRTYEPLSTRAYIQNSMFNQRYLPQ